VRHHTSLCARIDDQGAMRLRRGSGPPNCAPGIDWRAGLELSLFRRHVRLRSRSHGRASAAPNYRQYRLYARTRGQTLRGARPDHAKRANPLLSSVLRRGCGEVPQTRNRWLHRASCDESTTGAEQRTMRPKTEVGARPTRGERTPGLSGTRPGAPGQAQHVRPRPALGTWRDRPRPCALSLRSAPAFTRPLASLSSLYWPATPSYRARV